MAPISRLLDVQPVRSIDHYVELGGGRSWRAALQASPTEIIDLLWAAGLRGRGGAGFPTGRKWQTVAASRSAHLPTTVVVNAAEGEPGTFKDRALLRTNPYRVLEGAIVAAIAMETDQVRIGIKASFGREIERLHTAIAEIHRAGWATDLDVQLVLGPSSYLFGEETALLEVLEGRQPFPRVAPPYRRGVNADFSRSAVGAPLATIGGSLGAPALVDNVETLANVPLIVDKGPEWFRAVGTERSPGTIVCTVSGATRRSGVGEFAMGSTLREVIDTVGWGPREGHEIQVVLAGTANPLIPAHLLDTPLTYEAMRDAGSGLGSAGFIVFDETTGPAAVAAGVLRFLAVESCGQCEPCKTDGLFIAERLRRSLREVPTPEELAELRRRIGTVTNGARCNLAQQQALVASSLLELFPEHAEVGPTDTAGGRVAIAPIAELVAGRALLDLDQLTKQPDWTHDATGSGAPPAARLANTPVQIAARTRSRRWPEWRTGSDPRATTSHPLEIVDDAHDAIFALIELALGADEADVGARTDELILAVRKHIDVTQRVLYPMVRRTGAEEGDGLADRAEGHERVLVRLVQDLGRSTDRHVLHELGAEMQTHADLEDEVLELLRARLDPSERSGLADGLATAMATSMVRRPPTFPREPAPEGQRSLRIPGPQARRAPTVPATSESGPSATSTIAPAASSEAAAASSPPATRHLDPAGPPVDAEPSTLVQILVGVDGSSAAAAALGWAGRLATRAGAQVIVSNVLQTSQAELPPDEFAVLRGEAERYLQSDLSVPLQQTGISPRALQLTGSPDSLLTAASAAGVDLLVVGTRGPGRAAALHFGSVAHHLAHHTQGPLAIVPVEGADVPTDRLVLGVDGSPGSQSAVAWVAKVAGAARVDVTVVCAFRGNSVGGLRAKERGWRRAAEEAISREWVAPLRAARLTIRTRIVENTHLVPALDTAAQEERAGWIVVGTAGLNGATGLRLGRVPLQLVHHTRLPVVLVPAAGQTERPADDGDDLKLESDRAAS